ncbi:acyl-CoA ligase (AMP-forming), exosortase A system-associated [Pseudorhodoferax sp. Leaf274]|uniref:acyl-CoA ligase (AMP-forming), exosortase A system-associated n=1 Tax=Pseudorhodoferax sp. Leaf274 TaxID=1736318 RepID=UPI00070267D8|nr:acyl-CoA ligase (AMP-forming), exosortase A system-associated [Pseudorhodoferax sp. Leaf274]KQP41143.1 hypothetical protein ASF44_30330 [Pseudorhodoferax sp. Leaf274]
MSHIRNLHALLCAACARKPDRIALEDEVRRVTYSDLQKEVDQLARKFQGMQLQPRARIAIWLDKSVDCVAAILACAGGGWICVPVNPRLKPDQVAHILEDCGAQALVTTLHRGDQLLEQTACVRASILVLVFGAKPAAAGPSPLRWLSELPQDTRRPLASPCDNDPAMILYTSGSSGRPKGVVVSHRNLIVGCHSVNEYLGTRESDVILALLPISFDAGLSQLTTGLLAGARVVLHTPLLPQKIPALVSRHGITSITAVPPLWSQLASASWHPEDAASVRLFANTGGHLSEPLLRSLRGIFRNATPFLMYGLTEAFRSTYLDPREVERRPSSIGKAIPNAEILVLREDGSRCAPDEPGELVHRGPLVSLGYWNDPDRTQERFRLLPRDLASGLVPEIAVWSGDIVRLDQEGFLYYVGRRDEQIKTAGYRISPTEIESVVAEVACVAEVVAFGIPAGDAGDTIVAVVVPRGESFDSEEVHRHCTRRLPPYMVPQIQLRDCLPLSPNGKFDRAALRASVLEART